MSDPTYHYHSYAQPDPPHQPLYLGKMLSHLKPNGISRVIDAGFEMYGIDLSAGGIAKARTRYANTRFFVGSVYDDFEKLTGVPLFDAVVSVEVIEHLYSPREFVQRANAALRPGGLLIVTTPYWGYLKNVALALTNRMDRALTPLWDVGHIKHWSFRTLKKLLTTEGFEYVSFHGAGRNVPFLWNGMMMIVRKPDDSKPPSGIYA